MFANFADKQYFIPILHDNLVIAQHDNLVIAQHDNLVIAQHDNLVIAQIIDFQ